jgi:hypothetical protein
MLHHRLPFFGGQLRGIVHDVRYRTIDLSNVMEKSNTLDTALKPLVSIAGNRELQCVVRNATGMRACFGVVGVDCVEQALERGGSKPLEHEAVASLTVIKRACDCTSQKRGVA